MTFSSKRCVLAVDHGTSGIKTSIVDETGSVLATESCNLPTRFFENGGAEQDPDQWWKATKATARLILKKGVVRKDSIKAVCVSSTFSSTVAVDRQGEILAPCLTWMDRRGAPHIKRHMGGFPSFEGYYIPRLIRWIYRTAGAPTLSGKDDLSHLLYWKYEHPDVYQKTYKFLPSKDFFNLRFTGKFKASNDSITLFWLTNTRDPDNIHYDERLIREMQIDADKLPELKSATDILGQILPEVAEELGLAPGVQVVMGSPDHQAAAIGAGAVNNFTGHLYVGTSSWIQCTIPFKKTDPFHSIASLPTAIPGKYYCANEQDLAGGCLSFLLNNVMYHKNSFVKGEPPRGSYELLDTIAGEVPAGSNRVIFMPWLNGERTPIDDATLRGGLFNLSTTTNLDHMIRAVMEGVAYNARWSLGHIESFIGHQFPFLNMIGGGALSDVWCQIYADVLEREIRRVKNPRQANARGAAMIAAVGMGWLCFDDIEASVVYDGVFSPNPANQKIYNILYYEFLKLYKRNRSIFRRLNRRRT